MLRHLTQFYRPHTIQEACTLLEDRIRKNVPLAGGTYLSAIDDATIDGLVDLKKLQLSSIRSDNQGFHIGANSVSEIGINGPLPALSNAIFDAVGVRLVKPPFTAEKILTGIKDLKKTGHWK